MATSTVEISWKPKWWFRSLYLPSLKLFLFTMSMIGLADIIDLNIEKLSKTAVKGFKIYLNQKRIH